MLGSDWWYPKAVPKRLRPLRGRCFIRFAVRGCRFAQPPANSLNPFGVLLLPQRLVYNDERWSVGTRRREDVGRNTSRRRRFRHNTPIRMPETPVNGLIPAYFVLFLWRVTNICRFTNKPWTWRCISSGRWRVLTSGFLPSALRVALRAFKIVPDDFVPLP